MSADVMLFGEACDDLEAAAAEGWCALPNGLLGKGDDRVFLGLTSKRWFRVRDLRFGAYETYDTLREACA